ncbi:MAG: hypothetical protein LBN27_06700 [Prevotellaceae bacterium]|jgi:hypothetical protein|nr:hypothetical protein [Prevotellaceae bacterium]
MATKENKQTVPATSSDKELRAMQNTQAEEMQQIIAEVEDALKKFGVYENTYSPDERMRLVSVGIKNFGFLQTAYDSAQMNPALVPSFLDMGMYAWTIDDYRRKRALFDLLQNFMRIAQDSMIASGDEAYHYSLMYYNYVREAARQKVAVAEGVYNQLSPYFKKSKSKKGNEEPTQAQVERDVRALLHGTKDGKIVIENETPAALAGKHKVLDEIQTGHVEGKITSEFAEKE